MCGLVKKSWIVGLWLVTLLYSAGRASGQQAPADEAQQQIRQMQQIEDRWSDALAQRDQYALELVLAPQFIDIAATGEVTSRNQQIARLFVKNGAPVSTERKVVSTRLVGNIAIVNGTYVTHWKVDKGPVDEKGIFSHVFEHTTAGWLCLNAQQTVVSEGAKQTAAKQKPKSRPGDAALPTVYKGPSGTQPAPAPGSGAPPG
jgi:hypothetical protein